jgi:hypothetical protein
MLQSTPLAFFDPAMIAMMIPVMALMIPIVALLTTHQRKMAEIIRDQNASAHSHEIAALRQEIRELKQILHQQTIALDGMSPSRIAPPEIDRMRLEG